MRLPLSAIVVVSVAIASQCQHTLAFTGAWTAGRSRSTLLSATNDDEAARHSVSKDYWDTRRSVLKKASLVAGSLATSFVVSEYAQAAVGTLPEFSDTNAVLRGLTVNVADQSQQDSMIGFLTDAFDFQVLRQRKVGSTTDTVCLSMLC